MFIIGLHDCVCDKPWLFTVLHYLACEHPYLVVRGKSTKGRTRNDSGKKLTDLPGGPGDKSIYGKFYGDMAKTKNSYTGERVYKNDRPTIFDEGTQVTDKGKTILL